MNATTSLLKFTDRLANGEKMVSKYVRFGVPALVSIAMLAGVVVGGAVPALPFDLVTVLG